jgi:hypothetical protein
MNKPYINVEGIFELFGMTAEESLSQPVATDPLRWLAEFLAREHTTMNASDWNGLVSVGALLWQAQRARDGTGRRECVETAAGAPADSRRGRWRPFTGQRNG